MEIWLNGKHQWFKDCRLKLAKATLQSKTGSENKQKKIYNIGVKNAWESPDKMENSLLLQGKISHKGQTYAYKV